MLKTMTVILSAGIWAGVLMNLTAKAGTQSDLSAKAKIINSNTRGQKTIPVSSQSFSGYHSTVALEVPPTYGEGFESGLVQFRRHDEAYGDILEVIPNAGLNGSHALHIRRTRSKAAGVAIWDLPKLNSNYSYRVSVHYRTAGIANMSLRAAGLALSAFKNGKREFNIDPSRSAALPTKPGEWKICSFDFTPKAGYRYHLRLMLFYGCPGEIWFDYVTVEPLSKVSCSMHLLAPCGLLLGPNGDFSIKVNPLGTASLRGLFLLLSYDKKHQLFPIGPDGVAHGQLGKIDIPEKWLELTAMIVNPVKKEILAEEKFRLLTKTDIPKPLRGHTSIDPHGRMLLDGKPFFPIGIYVTWIRTQKYLDLIKAGGFNFISCYTGWALNIQKEMNDAARESPPKAKNDYGSEAWKADTKRSLDMIDSSGLKIVANEMMKSPSHPAVLAYYMSDEAPRSAIPALRKYREKVSSNDPWHATVALTCHPADFIEYSKTGDILSVDSYPISAHGAHSMNQVRTFLDASHETGSPGWLVLQAFNWGAFNDPGKYAAFAYPTETEMRSMALLGIIKGMKGICFYDFSTIHEIQEKRDPGSFQKFWPQVTAVAHLLQKLTPWVLSLEDAPLVKVVAHSGSTTEARAFRADGKVIVIITSDGPGSGAIEFKIAPELNLKSQFGKTRQIAPGHYVFNGKDIDSDILFEG